MRGSFLTGKRSQPQKINRGKRGQARKHPIVFALRRNFVKIWGCGLLQQSLSRGSAAGKGSDKGPLTKFCPTSIQNLGASSSSPLRNSISLFALRRNAFKIMPLPHEICLLEHPPEATESILDIPQEQTLPDVEMWSKSKGELLQQTLGGGMEVRPKTPPSFIFALRRNVVKIWVCASPANLGRGMHRVCWGRNVWGGMVWPGHASPI